MREEIKHYDKIWRNPDYNWPKQGYHHFAEEHKLNPHLDAGCGSGLVKSDVYVEVSREALRRFKGQRVLASVHALPFRDKAFESVSALELLEHIDEPLKALDEMRRVTRKRLIISVPERGHHKDPTHKRDVDYYYYILNPSIVENRDHRWCIVECLSQ